MVILGSRGFVGARLHAFLTEHGHECRGVPRQEIDLCEPEAADKLRAIVEPSDAIVVAAALTPDKGRDVATLMKNLRMAECLVQALSDKSCAHLLYVSSDAVYDGRTTLISEETAPTPTDLYSLMHIARERMLGHAAQARGIPFCALRPVAIFGSGDTHNSYGPNRFMRMALKERRIQLFGGGEERRDHVYVADVAAAIGLALQYRSRGVLNVASGRAISFGDLAVMIRQLVGADVVIESLPRSGPVTHRHFDTTALTRNLPLLRLTTLEDALEQSLREMREMVA